MNKKESLPDLFIKDLSLDFKGNEIKIKNDSKYVLFVFSLVLFNPSSDFIISLFINNKLKETIDLEYINIWSMLNGKNYTINNNKYIFLPFLSGRNIFIDPSYEIKIKIKQSPSYSKIISRICYLNKAVNNNTIFMSRRIHPFIAEDKIEINSPLVKDSIFCLIKSNKINDKITVEDKENKREINLKDFYSNIVPMSIGLNVLNDSGIIIPLYFKCEPPIKIKGIESPVSAWLLHK